jgi:hypothetical protein
MEFSKSLQLPWRASVGSMSETSSSHSGIGKVSSHANRNSAPAASASNPIRTSADFRNGSGSGSCGESRLRTQSKVSPAASPALAATAEINPSQRRKRDTAQPGSGSSRSAGRIVSTRRSPTEKPAAPPKKKAVAVPGLPGRVTSGRRGKG